MTLFQWLMAPLMIASAIICLLRVHRGSLPRFGGLAWTVIWMAGTLLILKPGLTTSIGSFLGIGRGADFVFYLAVVSGLYALLALYRRVRHMEITLTELGREQAIRDVTAPLRPGPPDGGTAGNPTSEKVR
jgi:hypothetical protein